MYNIVRRCNVYVKGSYRELTKNLIKVGKDIERNTSLAYNQKVEMCTWKLLILLDILLEDHLFLHTNSYLYL